MLTESKSQVKPAPDMGATICHPNDRYAATIRACYGHAGASHGAYKGWPLSLEVIKDEDDTLRRFTLRADGSYKEQGSTSPILIIGEREDYQAPEI